MDAYGCCPTQMLTISGRVPASTPSLGVAVLQGLLVAHRNHGRGVAAIENDKDQSTQKETVGSRKWTIVVSIFCVDKNKSGVGSLF